MDRLVRLKTRRSRAWARWNQIQSRGLVGTESLDYDRIKSWNWILMWDAGYCRAYQEQVGTEKSKRKVSIPETTAEA